MDGMCMRGDSSRVAYLTEDAIKSLTAEVESSASPVAAHTAREALRTLAAASTVCGSIGTAAHIDGLVGRPVVAAADW